MPGLTSLSPLETVDPAQVDALLDAAFGADRRGRTAYRVRAGMAAIPGLSLAALHEDGALAGSIQCWPVAFRGDDGAQVPMIMVGPVAVRPDLQQGGIGRALMEAMLAAAATLRPAGHDALMLIGDPEYYGRFFGFSADRTGGWQLPGPFERRRLLARGDAVPDGTGMIGPRLAMPA